MLRTLARACHQLVGIAGHIGAAGSMAQVNVGSPAAPHVPTARPTGAPIVVGIAAAAFQDVRA
ncbi:MAG: hypothetical protein LLG44_14920 [Chloroflexi bacterium]|nr:hypothetical protein [Chloroflexota bacterium]